MAEGREHHGGGILGLVDLIDNAEAASALEADLIHAGMRLRWFPAADYTWRDLAVFVRHLGQDSALARVQMGKDSPWTLTTQLLALQADYLRMLLWMRSKDGAKGRNRPKPIPRPGIDDGKKKLGGTTKMSAEKMSALLGM